MYEWKEDDYAFYRWKEKTKSWEEKKIESITGQIFYVIWQIQEVKFRIDALEKQTISSYDKAENLG